MRRFQLRWSNFRSFQDSGWFEVRPITIIIGANASGKTSLVAPLLLLKQTLESGDAGLAVKTQGSLSNVGSYEDLVFRHDTAREVEFSFRFDRRRSKPDQSVDKVGSYPPGAIDIRFRQGERESPPLLSCFVVRDIYGRRMLARRRLKSGRYSITGPCAPAKGGEFHNAIRRSAPEHFLFSADSAFQEKYQEAARLARRRAQTVPREEVQLEIDESTQMYFSIVTHSGALIQHLLNRTAYIGPLRERPRRLYEVSGEKPEDVGTRGELAPEILYRQRSRQLLDIVNEWVARFEFGLKLSCTRLTEGAFNITLRRAQNSPEVNLADTGFGLSQVLPIIVQGFYGGPNGLFIAEQPEIHLNPRLQAMLGDLFAAIAQRRISVVVETHSEHLVLRLRRLIAEGTIRASDVALYFAERDRDESAIREVPLRKNGHIRLRDWPKGFFEESLRESLALASAQSARRSDAR